MATCTTCGTRNRIFAKLLVARRHFKCKKCATVTQVDPHSVFWISVLGGMVVALIGMVTAFSGEYLRGGAVFLVWLVVFLGLYDRAAVLVAVGTRNHTA